LDTLTLLHSFILLSDRTIKIYNVSEDSYEHTATIQGHEGPVWEVSWAHPKFGSILASCSFDGSVLIHREQQQQQQHRGGQQPAGQSWGILHASYRLHESSVNSVQFHPELLMAAAASADGRVSILSHQPHNHTWLVEYIDDCPTGVNAVAWAPNVGSNSGADKPRPLRLVSGGCDHQIRIYAYDDQNRSWNMEFESGATSSLSHTDWVRDVAWAPRVLNRNQIVASCSEDGTVLIWKELEGGNWEATKMHDFGEPVWRVSWSMTGHLLAVSSGTSTVTLWKAGLDGAWIQVQTKDEAAVDQSQQPEAEAEQERTTIEM
jgi:protein transport protein SEC13